MTNIITIYLLVINIISFIFMGLDKWFSIKRKRRISEFTLLFLSFIGGFIGEMLGMLIFRHKTLHIKFIILNPLFLISWILMIIYFDLI